MSQHLLSVQPALMETLQEVGQQQEARLSSRLESQLKVVCVTPSGTAAAERASRQTGK